ncbi:hypothetical protein FJU08_19075 [Martelella alba]|uniref:Uncharacterized protein n=1 Tax=Martelella alba TaxID=2590451 RepID=A0A506U0H5_9HYPH|nr:hypothetical protein [Martelella alba]TPW27832.1 hypothetical protein FJU08_19075 [Martelella alba]
MTDRFATRDFSLTSPAYDGFAITPSDSTGLSETTRALYIGGGGDVTLIMASGNNLTFTGLNAGTILPVRVKQVLATGTTATTILGLV